MTAIFPPQSARLPDPVTTLVGRENELEALYALVSRPETRQVNLSGPGGVGKTRLGIAVAKHISENTHMDVGFIPLAPVRETALLASTIGAALGLGESGELSLGDRLATTLQDTPALLVLDNFEHLADGAPLVPHLLNQCATLKILTTSRRSLNVEGEIDFLVRPLAVPDPEDPLETAQETASFRLFIDRSFPGVLQNGTSQEMNAVGELCRRVNGLPLAVELAAARTKVLRPSDLLARFDSQLPFLADGPPDAPDRLQTMRNAIAWSYEMLSKDEQLFLRFVAVFSSGFTLEAAESVVSGDLKAQSIDVLSHLLDNNLVYRIDPDDGPLRFGMLEVIREFAVEALGSNGEEDCARQRHVEWLLRGVGDPDCERWFRPRGAMRLALPGEHDNLRTGLAWVIGKGDSRTAAQIAWSLLPYWWQMALDLEAIQSLEAIIALDGPLVPVERAGILCRLAEFTHYSINENRNFSAAQEAFTISREAQYPVGMRASLHCLALATQWVDPEQSVERFERALALSRQIGNPQAIVNDLRGYSRAMILTGRPKEALLAATEAIAFTENGEGMEFARCLLFSEAAWASGMLENYDQARDYANEGFALSVNIGSQYCEVWARRVQGEMALLFEQYRVAFEHFRLALQGAHRQGHEAFEACLLIEMAMLSQAVGDWDRAARLLGAAEPTRSQFAGSISGFVTWRFDDGPARRALSDARFIKEFIAGEKLSRVEAFQEAIGLTSFDKAGKPKSAALTPRQLAVLDRLALGESNDDIALALFISRRTAESHVDGILSKLNAKSRTDAIRIARERGLLVH